MTTRLPTPGADANQWGEILNNYLLVSHNPSGTLKPSSVGATQLQDNIVSLDNLTPNLQQQILNATGSQGVKGDKGDKGDPGDTGPQGPAGAPGQPGQPGQDGAAGQNGTDGREIQLRLSTTHIQWRYNANDTIPASAWTDLIAIADITGPQGQPGQDGTQGPKGDKGDAGEQGASGADGREIELGTSATHIRWRYTGESSWTNIVALSDLGGDGGGGTPGAGDGREIELGTSVTHIQWRYIGESEWTNLISLTDITGPRGAQGIQGLQGAPGEKGEKGDKGDPGAQGVRGERGETGAQGLPGQGVPAGGSAGQVLTKSTSADYATEWITPAMGGGGGGGFMSPATRVVASVDAPAHIKAAADYVCDGVGDQDEINAAMAAISNDVVGTGTQGGTVQLWGNRFIINGPIRMRTQCTLQGSGKFTTWISGISTYSPGENGGLVELYSRDSQYTRVRELTVNGGGANACGFYYMMGEGQSWDAAHSVTDVYVRNPLWHGLYMTWDKSLSTSRNKAYFFQNVKILDAGTTVNPQACGVYLDAADCIFISVDAGSSANHGFYIAGSNNRFSQCAGWFSGSLASAKHQGSGFYVDGARNQFISCKSQDNYGDGFHLRSSDHSLSACTADSNGYNRSLPGPSGDSGWTGSGFYLQGYNLRVDGNAIEKNEQGRPNYQRYHVETGRSNVHAIVTVVTGGNASVPKQGGPAFHSSSVVNIVGG